MFNAINHPYHIMLYMDPSGKCMGVEIPIHFYICGASFNMRHLLVFDRTQLKSVQCTLLERGVTIMLNEFKNLINQYKNGDEMTRFFTMPKILSSLDMINMSNEPIDLSEVDRLYLSIL